MVVIFTENNSARLQYTCRQMFEVFLSMKYEIVSDENNLPSYSVFINYSNRSISSSSLKFHPSGFLNESDVKNFTPPINFHDRTVKLFPSSESSLGFDIFSAIFWYLSRYEEYLPFKADAHGRFPAEESVAGKNGFLNLPLVDLWMKELIDEVNKINPGAMKLPKPEIINTIDVDNAFAYKGKEFSRQAGAFAKHFVKGEFSKIKERNQVLKGKNPDPYDTYDYIRAVSDKYQLKTIFFHLSGKLSLHDRNISVNNKWYQNLLVELKQWAFIGIHPSYQSHNDETIVSNEIKSLSKCISSPITLSRQHFLKLKFPDTFRTLIKNGIKMDYSLGYANSTGFRAGTGRKFNFFDVLNNQESDLMFQPLCSMDGTFRDYMKLNPGEAMKLISDLQNDIVNTGSTYVAIWHNETLGEYNGWEGWREVYEFQFSNFKNKV